MDEYTVAFWTPGTRLPNYKQLFGCASHGFANDSRWAGPEKGEHAFWEEKLKGILFLGGYERVLNNLENCGFTPRVCIAFFRKPMGIEQFIKRFNNLLPNVPIIGGGAAIGERQNMGDVFPLADEVVLLAVAEGTFELQSLNIYDQTEIEIEINKTSARGFDKVRLLPDGNWQSAIDFYHQQQEIRGINRNDFESVAFNDLKMRNIHCSIKHGQILTGANLPDTRRLMLCAVDRRDAVRRLSEFISKERSLIIGCAGIRSLILEPLIAGRHSLVSFLFGEVVACKNIPMFGNLMLARLTYK